MCNDWFGYVRELELYEFVFFIFMVDVRYEYGYSRFLQCLTYTRYWQRGANQSNKLQRDDSTVPRLFVGVFRCRQKFVGPEK